MKNMLTKPIKDWNVIDLTVAGLGAMALIPVGFWITMKSFGFIDKIENRQTEEVTTEE